MKTIFLFIVLSTALIATENLFDLGFKVLDTGSKVAGKVGEQALSKVPITQEEIDDTGAEIHEEIREEEGLIAVDSANAELYKIKTDLEKITGSTYQFFIIESEVVNAYAHAGNYIYLCRGLLDAFKGQLGAIAFVVAHEAAHNELGHTNAIVAKRKVLAVGGALTQNFGTVFYNFVTSGYDKQQELDSDAEALKYIKQCDYKLADAEAALNLLNEKKSATTPPSTTRHKFLTALGKYLSSHPPIRERRENLRKNEGK